MHIGSTAGSTFAYQEMERIFSKPPVRYELWLVRVNRSGLRSSRSWKILIKSGQSAFRVTDGNVRLLMKNDNEVVQGGVGELCVKGPGVMTCYYNDEKSTSEVLKDGWLYTGDMAMQDEQGFYYLVDRKKDVIVSGGENIYPVQIEDFLRRHDKIKDVAVIGLFRQKTW